MSICKPVLVSLERTIASPQIPADDTYLPAGKGEEEISLEIMGSLCCHHIIVLIEKNDEHRGDSATDEEIS